MGFGGYVVGEPRTEAGVRTVHIPPHLLPGLRRHLEQHATSGSNGLLFPAPNGEHLHSSSFARSFAKAVAASGRPDATPHTLRHTGVSFSHKARATFAENNSRAGQTSEAMTLLCTHRVGGGGQGPRRGAVTDGGGGLGAAVLASGAVLQIQVRATGPTVPGRLVHRALATSRAARIGPKMPSVRAYSRSSAGRAPAVER